VADANPFSQDALEKNRSGQLAESQYNSLRGQSKDSRRSSLTIALGAAVIGLLVWFAPGPASAAATKPLAGIVLLLVAAFFFVRGMSGGDPVTRDLRSGYVESIEGAIAKQRIVPQERTATSSYYFHVEGKRLEVNRAQFDWAPGAGHVRLFFLPNSKRVVNFERLPDPAVPVGQSRPDAIKAALSGMHPHESDREGRGGGPAGRCGGRAEGEAGVRGGATIKR